jgi:hypothetical protein
MKNEKACFRAKALYKPWPEGGHFYSSLDSLYNNGMLSNEEVIAELMKMAKETASA